MHEHIHTHYILTHTHGQIHIHTYIYASTATVQNWNCLKISKGSATIRDKVARKISDYECELKRREVNLTKLTKERGEKRKLFHFNKKTHIG